MYRERIRATPSWKKSGVDVSRYDCVFVESNPEIPGFQGMLVARVRIFFSFSLLGVVYPCVLVDWFERVSAETDPDTLMWTVRPEVRAGVRVSSVIHLDCVLRGAHLLGIFGNAFVPLTLHYSDTLDVFKAYYVNKYIDHHAFEVVF